MLKPFRHGRDSSDIRKIKSFLLSLESLPSLQSGKQTWRILRPIAAEQSAQHAAADARNAGGLAFVRARGHHDAISQAREGERLEIDFAGPRERK